MTDFILYALLAGLGVALVAGPLGSFVVWRRMAYFGDTLSHSALLGIALGISLDINPGFAVVICCLLVALLLVGLQQQKLVSTDTLLGILAHSALSLGVISIGLLDIRLDLMAYLFGDLLTVTSADLLWIFAGAGMVLVLLIYFWTPLVTLCIDEDLARAEGHPVAFLRLLLMVLIALVIAVAMKIVGVLLITSLLIIPAAAARGIAKSPEAMAIMASLLGCLAVILGVGASLQWDTATGPSIVLSAALVFAVLYLWSAVKAR